MNNRNNVPTSPILLKFTIKSILSRLNKIKTCYDVNDKRVKEFMEESLDILENLNAFSAAEIEDLGIMYYEINNTIHRENGMRFDLFNSIKKIVSNRINNLEKVTEKLDISTSHELEEILNDVYFLADDIALCTNSLDDKYDETTHNFYLLQETLSENFQKFNDIINAENNNLNKHQIEGLVKGMTIIKNMALSLFSKYKKDKKLNVDFSNVYESINKLKFRYQDLLSEKHL